MFAILLAMSVLSDPATPLAQAVVAVDSTTQLAIDLQLERIKLLEAETLMHESHPAVQLQHLDVHERQSALYALIEKGCAIDRKRVDVYLEVMLERTRAELANKSKLYSSNHPQLALLELRLRAIQCVQARRALVE
jgi:hypothetical protein